MKKVRRISFKCRKTVFDIIKCSIHHFSKSSSEDSNVEHVYEGITTAEMRQNAKFELIMVFNAKIGQDNKNDNPNVSRFGLGQRNSRGDM